MLALVPFLARDPSGIRGRLNNTCAKIVPYVGVVPHPSAPPGSRNTSVAHTRASTLMQPTLSAVPRLHNPIPQLICSRELQRLRSHCYSPPPTHYRPTLVATAQRELLCLPVLRLYSRGLARLVIAHLAGMPTPSRPLLELRCSDELYTTPPTLCRACKSRREPCAS